MAQHAQRVRVLPTIFRCCYRSAYLNQHGRHTVLRLPRVSFHSIRPCLSAVAEEAISPPGDGDRSYPPKIERIVQDISQLTLLETSQLNELLKSTLNIPDAPMMAMGAMPMAVGASAEGEVGSKKEEQTEFTVKLVKYADDSKIKLIKEVKTLMEGMNLVQSKKFVEGVPQVIRSEVNKEEADRLKAALEAVGGVVELE